MDMNLQQDPDDANQRAAALIAASHRYKKIDRIARVCHEVNRAYSQAMADPKVPPSLVWEEAPEWQRASCRMGVDMHLTGLETGHDFGPDASHAAWMANKIADGWKVGPMKNETAKEHPLLVPFDQLPVADQAKDFIFRAIVHALKERL